MNRGGGVEVGKAKLLSIGSWYNLRGTCHCAENPALDSMVWCSTYLY